jgi:hypothetical protein
MGLPQMPAEYEALEEGRSLPGGSLRAIEAITVGVVLEHGLVRLELLP